VAVSGFGVNQMFLILTLGYILIPTLMIILSLVLGARVSRVVNIVVSLLYAVSIILSCIGETWVYYLIGSLVEVILLIAIAVTAWRWPRENADASVTARTATSPAAEGTAARTPGSIA